MKTPVACLLVSLLLLTGCGGFATSTPPAPPTAPTATFSPFDTNGCKTCDVQQRRLQATAAGQ